MSPSPAAAQNIVAPSKALPHPADVVGHGPDVSALLLGVLDRDQVRLFLVDPGPALGDKAAASDGHRLSRVIKVVAIPPQEGHQQPSEAPIRFGRLGQLSVVQQMGDDHVVEAVRPQAAREDLVQAVAHENGFDHEDEWGEVRELLDVLPDQDASPVSVGHAQRNVAVPVGLSHLALDDGHPCPDNLGLLHQLGLPQLVQQLLQHRGGLGPVLSLETRPRALDVQTVQVQDTDVQVAAG
mmetsp:Transcript_7971/g.27396  ORF Transcript_7971/g.27396 Transcript_7971/m.27396 type:complete len:239 (-) Transcript_7971:594-1310(-)